MKQLISFMLIVCILSGCNANKPGNESSSQTQGGDSAELTEASEITGELKLVLQLSNDDSYAVVEGEKHFLTIREMEGDDYHKLYDANGELVADLGTGRARSVSGGDYILILRDNPKDSTGGLEVCELYCGHELIHTFYSSEGYISFDEQDKILYYDVMTAPDEPQTTVAAYDYGNRKLLWEVEGSIGRTKTGPVMLVTRKGNSSYIVDKWTGEVLSEGMVGAGESYSRYSHSGHYILDDKDNDHMLRYYTINDELVFEKPLESGNSFIRMLASGAYATRERKDDDLVYVVYDATGNPIGELECSNRNLQCIYDSPTLSVLTTDRGRGETLIIFEDGSVQKFQGVENSLSVSEYSKIFGLCTDGDKKYLLHYETQQLHPIDSKMGSMWAESPNGAYVFVYDENYDTCVIDQAGTVVYKSEYFCRTVDDRYFFEAHPDGPMLIPIDGGTPLKLDYEGSSGSVNSNIFIVEDENTYYVYQLVRK